MSIGRRLHRWDLLRRKSTGNEEGLLKPMAEPFARLVASRINSDIAPHRFFGEAHLVRVGHAEGSLILGGANSDHEMIFAYGTNHIAAYHKRDASKHFALSYVTFGLKEATYSVDGFLIERHVCPGWVRCRLTNQANRLRADGAQAPPASSPVERVVRPHLPLDRHP